MAGWTRLIRSQTRCESAAPPSGTAPPPAPLANVTMSGTAFACWNANHVPVRPNPDMTSSQIQRMSLASHRRRSSSR